MFIYRLFLLLDSDVNLSLQKSHFVGKVRVYSIEKYTNASTWLMKLTKTILVSLDQSNKIFISYKSTEKI